MLRKIITYQLFCLLLVPLTAQVSVEVQTDKFDYAIGDYIQITIKATGDSTNTYYWPPVEEIAPYEIISAQPIDTLTADGKTMFTQQITYSIYEEGKYYFPQVFILYKMKRDTTTLLAMSDSLPFNVITPDVDTTAAFKPIKDIKLVTVRDFTWMQILLLAHAIIAIAFLVYFFIIRKENKPTPKPLAKPIRPLHEIFLEQLRALDEKKLWQQDRLKFYYSELTDILRDYLEERFYINAMESTSDEIIEQIQHIPEAKGFTNDISFILQLADMAKFAKSRPLANENVRAMELTVNFVENTKIIPPTPEKI